MKIEEKFVETKFGKICYLEIGEGEKTAVYLHGWFGNADFSLNLEDIFCSRGYRIIAPSLPGHGKSYSINLNFSCADLKNTLKEFYQVLNLENPLTVGHSVGGALAWEMSDKVVIIDAYTNPRGKIPLEILWHFSKRLRKRLVKKLRFKPCAILALDVFKNLTVGPAKKDTKSLVFWGKEDKVALLDDWLKLTGYDKSKILEFPGDHWWYLNQLDELKAHIIKFIP